MAARPSTTGILNLIASQFTAGTAITNLRTYNLVLYNSAGTQLMTGVIGNGQFAAVAGGVANLTAPVTLTLNVAGQTIAYGTYTDLSGNVSWTPLTVGLAGSGAEVILSSMTSNTGVTVTDATVKWPTAGGLFGTKLNLQMQNDLLGYIVAGAPLIVTTAGLVTVTAATTYLRLYAGTIPATADATPGLLVAEMALTTANFATAALAARPTGVLAVPVVNAGTVTYGRLYNTTNFKGIQFTAGKSGTGIILQDDVGVFPGNINVVEAAFTAF